MVSLKIVAVVLMLMGAVLSAPVSMHLRRMHNMTYLRSLVKVLMSSGFFFFFFFCKIVATICVNGLSWSDSELRRTVGNKCI